jgi:hypothetical protein
VRVFARYVFTRHTIYITRVKLCSTLKKISSVCCAGYLVLTIFVSVSACVCTLCVYPPHHLHHKGETVQCSQKDFVSLLCWVFGTYHFCVRKCVCLHVILFFCVRPRVCLHVIFQLATLSESQGWHCAPLFLLCSYYFCVRARLCLHALSVPQQPLNRSTASVESLNRAFLPPVGFFNDRALANLTLSFFDFHPIPPPPHTPPPPLSLTNTNITESLVVGLLL